MNSSASSFQQGQNVLSGSKRSEIENHYRGNDGARYHAARRLPDGTLPWVARRRSSKIQQWVSPDDVVLEYGCGSGWNLAKLKCGRKIGFDISSIVRPDVEALGIEFESQTADILTGGVDVVLSHHSLEHMPVPSEALAEMRRMLKPGGRLILVVPYEMEGTWRRFDRADKYHHVYSWNVQSLGNLVSSLGFDVVSGAVSRCGYDRAAAVSAAPFGEWMFRLLVTGLMMTRPRWEVRLIAEAI